MVVSLLSSGGKNHSKRRVDFSPVLSILGLLICSWRVNSIENNIVGLIRSHEGFKILTLVMEVSLIQLLCCSEVTGKGLHRTSQATGNSRLRPR